MHECTREDYTTLSHQSRQIISITLQAAHKQEIHSTAHIRGDTNRSEHRTLSDWSLLAMVFCHLRPVNSLPTVRTEAASDTEERHCILAERFCGGIIAPASAGTFVSRARHHGKCMIRGVS